MQEGTARRPKRVARGEGRRQMGRERLSESAQALAASDSELRSCSPFLRFLPRL